MMRNSPDLVGKEEKEQIREVIKTVLGIADTDTSFYASTLDTSIKSKSGSQDTSISATTTSTSSTKDKSNNGSEASLLVRNDTKQGRETT